MIEDIRSFNRYYTIILGLLEQHLHNSNHTLLEARIIFETNLHNKITSSELIDILNIDKGYLSRTLKKMMNAGYLSRTISAHDRRQSHFELSQQGAKEFERLNKESDLQVVFLTKTLEEKELENLVSHMKAIQNILTSN